MQESPWFDGKAWIVMDPAFSVIIPTRARDQALQNCLVGLAAQDCSTPAFEVVVVDDGSPEPPHCQGFTSSLALTLLRQPNLGAAAARNKGAEVARGRVLVFLDDDLFPEPDWLLQLASRMTASVGVGGRVRNALPDCIFSSHGQLLWDYLYQHYNPDPEDCGFLAGNLAVKAADFRELGGYREAFPGAAGEDRDFCHRWLASGRSLRYAPQAVVWHAHRYTLRSFIQQHYAYGRAARLHHRCNSLAPEPLAFYLGLLSQPLKANSWRSGLLMAAALLLSQTSHGIGYLAEFCKGHPDRREH